LFVSAPPDIDDLAMLAEFAQLALDRARAASARAEAVEVAGGDPTVHLLAFDRMGRAMRLALSLRRRFAREAETRATERVNARKERLKAALTPAIRIHAPFAERRDLDWVLAHRLETEAEALAELSFDAGVARLFELLGLNAETCVEAAEVHAAGSQQAPPDSAAALFTPELIARARQVVADVASSATGPP
jgi:hypothetical protein